MFARTRRPIDYYRLFGSRVKKYKKNNGEKKKIRKNNHTIRVGTLLVRRRATVLYKAEKSDGYRIFRMLNDVRLLRAFSSNQNSRIVCYYKIIVVRVFSCRTVEQHFCGEASFVHIKSKKKTLLHSSAYDYLSFQQNRK